MFYYCSSSLIPKNLKNFYKNSFFLFLCSLCIFAFLVVNFFLLEKRLYMDFSASLSQQQRQTFSPQMQQSLQLLQAPVAELRQLVAAELVCNPVLEEEKFFSLEGEAFFQGENIIEGDDLGDSWRDDFQTASASSRPIDKTTEERHQYLLESFPSEETLAAKIHAQSVAFPIEDQPIVQTIVGNLDEWGYFRATCTEVAQSMGVNEQKVDHVLKQVQQLDPPGVAARDLI